MPTLSVNLEDFYSLLGERREGKELCENLALMGVEAELSGEELRMEILHNRPDLLSPEGVARALKGFLGRERGLPSYRLSRSGIVVKVDRSVGKVRPFIAAGVVRGVKLTERVLVSLMQTQEKLHEFLGRRRKGSIGVYDLDKVEPPFTYTTVGPEELSFVPLDFRESLTPSQILNLHPKGREYGWILEGKERYPILLDCRGRVLSLPPIINSEETRVTEATTNLFIDVTGEKEELVQLGLVLMMTSLAERGFDLQTVRIQYPNRKLETPSLKPRRFELEEDRVREVLGLDLKAGRIAGILRRMRYGVEVKGKRLVVLAPPFRADLLHPVDLLEDVAIGYGYDRIPPRVKGVNTVGKKAEVERLSDLVRSVMVGLGFTEVMTYTLTNPKMNFEMMRTKGEAVEVGNPISEEFTILRTWLLPSLLAVLRSNKKHPLPQRIFEVGNVVLLDEGTETGAREVRRLGACVIGKGAGWNLIKAVAEALLREFGILPEIKPLNHPSFLEGRAAEFFWKGKRLGMAGEVHPEVLLAFELEHPVASLELDVEALAGDK
ncbi:MAG: phenylalanine--tRNA ligase subunit beta [Candidatus Hadarchaeales archaeon]